MDVNTWFDTFRQSKDYAFLQKKPLAYFSIEYALSDGLPTYAGGLGILAGDYIKELSDQKIPAVAVGMYYQKRYGFENVQIENISHPLLTPEDQELTPVTDIHGNPIIIKVPLSNKDVYVKAWLWQKESIPVYLLDTNVPENSSEDKKIGYELYIDDKEYRLKQEMILGIGGFRLLEALAITPSLYHMNEGHSALLVLEIIRHEMQKRHIGFHDAIKLASHHVVFTNHTLVPAGNDIFSNEMLNICLNRYASELEVPVTAITDLGTIKDSHDFSMSVLAMRLAGKINGVSKLHAETARKVWPDFNLEPVTNGIHVASWVSHESHGENKKKLLQYIKGATGNAWQENELLIGWARRMVLYKRPLALFSDIQHFLSIANAENRPVRVVISGIAHRADDEGKDLTLRLQNLVENELKGVVTYLSGYNKTLAKLLITGCDVWLNTPVIGSEACGTSGMKASLNGVLPLSTKDGWMAEVDINAIGWEIESDTIQTSLLTTIQEQVVPAYYSPNKQEWLRRQDTGNKLIISEFSTTRMLKDYFEKAYLPILTTSYAHY